ncbi:hypothetical protein HPB47_020857 [Ixodes persulcatus]|uniref:Uncharacterized protein n=1 Tax=Ixodes persulcatus TaxID=34615 RepID=A0AC60QEA8_IXOPE|nr:hypothetical protein HPB47_020857 [Ixodes persulcatus]
MADLADRYLEAQGTQSLGIKAEEKKQAPQPPRSIDKKDAGARPPLQCFLCDRVGHRAADCRERATTKASCWRCGQTEHFTNACQQGAKGRPQASCCVAAEQNQKEEPVVENGYVHLKNGDRIPVVNTTIAAEARNLMSGVPVRAGRVGKRTVTVLRDTGCSTVVVRRNLIPEEDLTGTAKAVYLVDGTDRMLPEARLWMQTPFFTGQLTAHCMESPLYDIILGNIPGARAEGEPNPEWEVDASAEEPGEDTERTGGPTLSAAVQTRLQKNTVDKKATGPTPLRVPDIEEGAFTPEALKEGAKETSTCVFLPVGLVVTLRCEFVRGAVFVQIISPIARTVFIFIVREPRSTFGSVWTWTPLR